MLPRRHILDVWEFVKDEKELLSMSTITLALDAVKYMDAESRKDHLVEALELNEFVCYMFPSQRPRNRSLLFHVVSDLLGLLMYGVPRKKRNTVENIESINYSEKNMEVYPVTEVWSALKQKVYTKKHGAKAIIEGFVKKIRIEMDVMERHPFVEDVFYRSREHISEWLPSLAGYYEKNGKSVKSMYQRWWATWLCREDKEKVLSGMVARLCLQVERDFGAHLDRDDLFASIARDKEENRRQNEEFSRWYREGVNLLLRM
jgi:hypothetical protein